MFEPLMGMCGNDEPHERHLWRRGLWQRKFRCTGISDDQWLKANPRLEDRVVIQGGFAEILPHKCFYRLTKMLLLPNNYVYHAKPNHIYWQCKCGEFYCLDRREVREILLYKKDYDQTWPS